MLAPALALLSLTALAQASDRPNFVFFLVDDLGWKDLGCFGSTFYETPNIDALAASGMVFTDAYACAPNCAPSRASLLSGKYTPRHGIYTVGDPRRGRHPFRRLEPVEIDLVARDGKDVLVRGPFAEDDMVVTSRFAEIGPGVRVKAQ